MNRIELPLDETLRDSQWHERSFVVGERHVSIMLRWHQGDWQAFLNACPHQGRRMDFAPGQFLTSPGGTLICPAHGAEFRPEDGFCINGPCRGASLQAIMVNEDPAQGVLLLRWQKTAPG